MVTSLNTLKNMVWKTQTNNEEAKRGEVDKNAQFSALVNKDNIVK